MKSISLQQKTYLIALVLVVVSIVAGISIVRSLNKAKDDADIINILGRQRMLSQAIGKAALGFAMNKQENRGHKDKISSINNYITAMRAKYTQFVVGPSKRAGTKISMHPLAQKPSAVPFPATFTKEVNEAYSRVRDLNFEFIAKDPVNPTQKLKTKLDQKAWNQLLKNPQNSVVSTLEKDKKLYIVYYYSDIATVQACADCHNSIKKKAFEIGDLLGIRKYVLKYSDDIALGRKELNPSATEIKQVNKAFETTLLAFKNGGKYPIDLASTKFAEVNALKGKVFQDKINEILTKYKHFRSTFNILFSPKTTDNQFRGAVATIIKDTSKLRDLSNDLVKLYSVVANENKADIKSTIIISCVLMFFIAGFITLFLRQSIILPIVNVSDILKDIAQGQGDLTKRIIVKNRDELGALAHWFNTFITKLNDIIGEVVDQAKNQTLLSQTQLETSEKIVASSDEVKQQTILMVASSNQMTGNIATVAETANSTSEDITAVSGAVKNLSSNINTVAVAAEQSSMNMVGINQNMDEVSKDINNIATLIDNMTKALAEITKSTQTTVKSIENASVVSAETLDIMGKLDTSSSEIGNIVKMIGNIANQTNMLALNATIEAASAGESGKGFAVVATEVKELAKKTQDSNNEIVNLIKESQSYTVKALSHSNSMSGMVEQVRKTFAFIASSINEQSNSSSMISTSVDKISVSAKETVLNVTEATLGLKEITKTVSMASQSAKESSTRLNESTINSKKIATITNENSQGVTKVNQGIQQIQETISKVDKLANTAKEGSLKSKEMATNLQHCVSGFKTDSVSSNKDEQQLLLKGDS